MREINELTPDQEAQLRQEADHWLANGRSVEPLDRKRAADAICALYAAVGRPTPAVLFFSSPARCILALRAMMKLGTERRLLCDSSLELQLQEQLRAQPIPKGWLQRQRQAAASIGLRIESQRRSGTWAQIWDESSAHFGSRIDSRIGPSLWVQLDSALRSMLWEQLRSRLWRSVHRKLNEQFREPVREVLETDSMSRSIRYGDDPRDLRQRLLDVRYQESHLDQIKLEIGMPGVEGVPRGLKADIWEHCMGAWWCASAVFYDFCARIGISYAPEQTRILRLWLHQCRDSHWWFECDGIVFVSHRPTVLKLDSGGRLHNERGAALEYGDGFRLCAIHGTEVEEDDVLHPERITVRRVEQERNLELRRALTSLYGQARYLKDSGATLVHQDERGKLWRKKREGDTDLVMIEVTNSTPEPNGNARSYLLRVPPDMKTAAEAVAWTFGMRSDQYNPNIET